ncbi:bifunctional DNA primase/polymerase [Nonomuraea polychroma]|uniref:bifunctional DNA primase/polymerase n=1 Tax=Nonomuraea polychroma TaxID=46176 RepID=UPI003D8CFDF0
MNSRFPTRAARVTPLEAARHYASCGWPVATGAYVTETGCSCGDVWCGEPGRHPIGTTWRDTVTTDVQVLSIRWVLTPRASVVVETGTVFDVVPVSHADGELLFRLWEGQGVPPVPVLSAAAGVLVFTCAHRDSESGWMVLPPVCDSKGADPSWLVPVTSANACRLPTAAQLSRWLADTPGRARTCGLAGGSAAAGAAVRSMRCRGRLR